jgi:hypothetical protein
MSSRRNSWSGGGPLTADQQFAALTRQQWMDAQQFSAPYENRLFSYSSDPRVVSDAMAEASADARRAFASGAAVQQRNLRSLGLSLSPDEQRAADRSTSLAASLADVGAQNRARDATVARQRSILGSPVPTIPQLPWN